MGLNTAKPCLPNRLLRELDRGAALGAELRARLAAAAGRPGTADQAQAAVRADPAVAELVEELGGWLGDLQEAFAAAEHSEATRTEAKKRRTGGLSP